MIAILRRTMAPAAVAAGLLVGLGTVSAAGTGPLRQIADGVIGVHPAAVGPAVQAVGTEVSAPITRTSPLSGLDVPSNAASPSITATPPSPEPVTPTAHPAARPASSARPARPRTMAAPRQPSSVEPDSGTAPAPTAVGVAYGVLVGPVGGCISCSGSVAGADGSSAHAVPIEILSTDVGGDSTTNGNDSGAIIATPANPLLSVALGSWMTSADADRSGSSARSRAASGDVVVGSGLVSAAALEASSDAQYDGTNSAAHSANNALHVTAADGAVDVILLHTDTSSDGSGRLYLASLNGTHIGESQGRAGIPIVVPGIARILLLSVGAAGGPGGSAAIGTVDQVLGDPHVTGLLYAYSAGGKAPSVVTVPPVTLPEQTGSGAFAPPATGSVSAAATTHPEPHSGPAVPGTGAPLKLGGTAMIAAGVALLATAIVRRRHMESAA